MGTKKQAPKDNTSFWDTEMLIGYINSDGLHKTSVSFCTKGEKKYISLTNQYRTQANPQFKVRSGFAIPYQSAEQVSALIMRGVHEAKKLMW